MVLATFKFAVFAAITAKRRQHRFYLLQNTIISYNNPYTGRNSPFPVVSNLDKAVINMTTRYDFYLIPKTVMAVILALFMIGYFAGASYAFYASSRIEPSGVLIFVFTSVALSIVYWNWLTTAQDMTVTVDDRRTITITEKAWFSLPEKTTAFSYYDVTSIVRERHQAGRYVLENHVITLRSNKSVVLPYGKNARFDALMEKLESEKRGIDPSFRIEQTHRQERKKERRNLYLIIFLPAIGMGIANGVFENHTLGMLFITAGMISLIWYLVTQAKAEKRRKEELDSIKKR